MDEKQFDLFQRTFQFAVDESRRDDGSAFDMSNWMVLKKSAHRVFDKTKIGATMHRTMPMERVTQCGTVSCLAGTAVMFNGGDALIMSETGSGWSVSQGSAVLTKDGRVVDVDDRAQELFGITSREANSLFYATEASIDELVERGTKLAETYGHTLEII
jgi:PAS domain-containing protein